MRCLKVITGLWVQIHPCFLISQWSRFRPHRVSAERSVWQLVNRASIITDIIRMSEHLEHDLVVANRTLMHRLCDDTQNVVPGIDKEISS